MKLKDVINRFQIYTTAAEEKMLEQLKDTPRPLSSFSERDQFTIEGLVRKSLVIKIGTNNPKVIANEL